MQFQDEKGQLACDTCPASTKPTSTFDACLCVDPCPKGKYGTSPTCADCPKGRYFVSFGATRLDDCGACPLGTWSDTLGASSLDSCTKCEAGTQGKTAAEGADKTSQDAACENCVAGRYQPSTGQASCIACGAGRYASVEEGKEKN
jgi:hypothetical protein